MSERPQDAVRPSIIRILASLYVELAILAFCILIISEAGRTRGPVFDVVGPDFLPTTVAGLVAALTLVQIVVHIASQLRRTYQATGEPISLVNAVVGLVFIAFTAVYVTVLSYRAAPFWLATTVFIIVLTLLLSREITWRDLALSLVIGLGMGLFLQFVFTRILIIDLPT
jgi:hypothetical protein